MPGLVSNSEAPSSNAVVPYQSGDQSPVVYPIRHGMSAPVHRLAISWGAGNNLRVTVFGRPDSDDEIGGRVVEVKLSADDPEIESDAERRRIAYGSVSPFAHLQSRRNSVSLLSKISPSPYNIDWWEYVMEYSKDIKSVLSSPEALPESVLGDPRTVIKKTEDPTCLKAAWELIEIFYVDKESQSWLPERMVDWLADFDSLFSAEQVTVHSTLVDFQEKLINLQSVEDDPRYWQAISSALALGWLDTAVKMLRLHGSYNLDQLSDRETENGLVEAVAVLISKMPRRRPDLAAGTLGENFMSKPDFMKGLESLYSLAQKCIQLKPSSSSHKLAVLMMGILEENTEVVLAECSRSFSPWMVAHAIELVTAGSDEADFLLHEERSNLGGISIKELHRLIYAQVLSSHSLTWQIAPIYLASCMKQGMPLLEKLLSYQPVVNNNLLLKILEICRLYQLDSVSMNIMKVAGVYHWKQGRKGLGVYWLQQARDEVRLNRIAQTLFDFVGKSISDENFKEWEGLIELLGADSHSAGGLDFLYKYRDFKRSLQYVSHGQKNDACQLAVDSLISLMKSPSTPIRFWLPLLYDSLKLLNWKGRPLLNVSQTYLLLNKLQELSTAKLRPNFVQPSLPPDALSSFMWHVSRTGNDHGERRGSRIVGVGANKVNEMTSSSSIRTLGAALQRFSNGVSSKCSISSINLHRGSGLLFRSLPSSVTSSSSLWDSVYEVKSDASGMRRIWTSSPLCMGRRACKIAGRKTAQNAKKMKLYSKIGKELVSAIKKGGTNPTSNITLATLIEKCKELDIPKDIVDRNIKRATEKGQEAYIEKVYGYGGASIVVEVLTDKITRSVAAVRDVAKDADKDQLLSIALDAGAEDVIEPPTYEDDTEEDMSDRYDPIIEPECLFEPDNGSELLPLTTVEVDDEALDLNKDLISRLLDLDDVDAVIYVYSNVKDLKLFLVQSCNGRKAEGGRPVADRVAERMAGRLCDLLPRLAGRLGYLPIEVVAVESSRCC
ncbi:unnamed protein product [Rhodiola kirilowii]